MAYYNPYYQQGLYGTYQPAGYQNPMQMPQQSYAAQGQPKPWEWVAGEIGAIAYQMPPGWPANQPIQLWDNKDQIIWVKSWNQMGAPNPMQKLRYTIEEQPVLPAGQSGANGTPSGQAEPQSNPGYVTKEDLDARMNELRDLIKSQQSGQNGQNGSNGGQNRGGNR